MDAAAAALAPIIKQYRKRYATIQLHIEKWQQSRLAIDRVALMIIPLLPRLIALQHQQQQQSSSSSSDTNGSNDGNDQKMGGDMGVLTMFEGLHTRLVARHVEQIDLALRTIHEYR
jgi:hypothetical protein